MLLLRLLIVTFLWASTACVGEPPDHELRRAAPASPESTETTIAPDTSAPAASSTTTTTEPFLPQPVDPDEVVQIALRIENRTEDPTTADFADWITSTLGDGRGWVRAGYQFDFSDRANMTILLAEGDEVDVLCAPYDTTAGSSCQNGPLVILRAERWREGAEKWTGDLTTYRQMLVNHEVGHLLGEHHPDPQCPAVGEPAPVMAQQTSQLEGCLPNPWPLDWEIACAQLRLEPLAPPYEKDPELVCDQSGPI